MLPDLDIPATLTALGALVTAIGVILIAYWSYRAKERASTAAEKASTTEQKVIALDGAVYALGKQIDGRLSELLKTATALARAEGVVEGQKDKRDSPY